MNIAVFIDRDGTINEDVNYLNQVENLCLIPRAIEAVKKINDRGLKAIVISNQSGVARGYLSEETLAEIHGRLSQLLAEQGAHLDGIYYCPHHPDEGCDCRKPASGMLLAAARDLDIDLAHSFMVGDKNSDVALGHKLGLTTVLVLTGYGREELEALQGQKEQPDFVADDLYRAVELIFERIDRGLFS